MITGHRIAAASAMLLAQTLASPLHAVPISTLASDNATVQVGGPRSGSSGKAFFNIEGSANGNSLSANVRETPIPREFSVEGETGSDDVGQGDLSLLSLGGGPFAYTVGTSGDVDSYVLVADAATLAVLVGRLNAGSPIRIVIGTGSATLAATWAGYTNSTYAGPTLHLDVTYDTSTPTQRSTWGSIKSLYR